MELDKLYSDKNLSRNYKEQPLKRGEKPCKNDVTYLYLTMNLSISKLSQFFGRNENWVLKLIKEYQLKKSKEQTVKAREVTMLERYGVINATYNSEFKEKMRKTSLEHYGVPNPNQCKEVRKKIEQTNLKRYGVINVALNSDVNKKARKTCQQRYGGDSPMCNSVTKEKAITTNFQKFGVANCMHLDSIKHHQRQTCVKRYGVKYPAQSNEIRQKLSEINSSPETQQKIYETKKKNHSFNISNPENLIYERLSEKFGKVLRQYKSEKYPFSCDFYIPEIDLYIEFQGNWTHGEKPYNEKDEEDIKLLEEWQEKATISDFYANAIEVWTISDVKKRKIAKENNLNWIEFFNLDEFEEWFDAIR